MGPPEHNGWNVNLAGAQGHLVIIIKIGNLVTLIWPDKDEIVVLTIFASLKKGFGAWLSIRSIKDNPVISL